MSKNSVQNILLKTLGGAVQSTARSLITSNLKKQVSSLFEKKKTMQDVESEIISKLGFKTTHYKLDKKMNISFKPSSIFLFEWLSSYPKIAGAIKRDDESGMFYFKDHLITNKDKVDLINMFVACTGIQSTAVSSHLENGLKLFDGTDYISSQFSKEFTGWNPSSPSMIDGWMKNVFGETLVDPDHASFLFKKWIVGTARRAINPGSSFDGCLTIQGQPGTGKTSFFRNLVPEPFDKRTGEIYCNIKHPQKFVESIVGKTIACFDELSVLDHAKTTETFKQLLSSQFIDTRMVWRKDPTRYLLRQGFAATVNHKKFISDSFLSRRLWVIEVNTDNVPKEKQRINFDYLFSNRKALWMEAVYLAQQNFSNTLSMEEQKLVEEKNLPFFK